ncbi:hypothetical protein FHT86_000824 [Rhizobium sp. BK313]|nr:hypothetical protein [Rhizobium sp. BK313]
MLDLSQPWVIGPVAWLATIAAVISFLGSLITRRGLTAGSLLSCPALAAFAVAGALYLWPPPTWPLLTVLLAQVTSAILSIMLGFLLRSVQVSKDSAHHLKIRPRPDLQLVRKTLLYGMALLVLWDGLTMIFYHTRCEDLTYSRDAARCMNGEMIMGVHGPFSNVYYACYFGILAFAVPIWVGFMMLRHWATRSEETPK